MHHKRTWNITSRVACFSIKCDVAKIETWECLGQKVSSYSIHWQVGVAVIGSFRIIDGHFYTTALNRPVVNGQFPWTRFSEPFQN